MSGVNIKEDISETNKLEISKLDVKDDIGKTNIKKNISKVDIEKNLSKVGKPER